jgi:hypothetical protein
MIQLLEELREEALNLTTKSLSPIGFDYRRRTKVERLLFLISKQYCKDKFGYELGGISYSHKKLFNVYAHENQVGKEGIQIVNTVFEISRMVSNLSSSDPYVIEETIEELGGTFYSMFDNLREKMLNFIKTVSRSYGFPDRFADNNVSSSD